MVLGTRHAFELCLFPSAVMLVASFLALSVKIPVHVVSAMQHLAAGIVLSAVAVELVPEILEAPSDPATVCGMTFGFIAGIGVLLLVSAVGGEADEDNEDEDDDDEDEENQVDGDHITRYRASSEATTVVPPELQVLSTDAEGSLTSSPPRTHTPSLLASGFLNLPGSAALRKRIASKPSKQALMRSSASQLSSSTSLNDSAPPDGASAAVARPFPYALAVAVGVDALVDGLLIGISSSSGAQAGVVITGALSIEMGFLGLTFATTLRKQSRSARVRAILLPPLLLLLGGVCGGAIAALLASSPPLHTGLLAFGVAALLYLVTEEVQRCRPQTSSFLTSSPALLFRLFFLDNLDVPVPVSSRFPVVTRSARCSAGGAHLVGRRHVFCGLLPQLAPRKVLAGLMREASSRDPMSGKSSSKV